MKAFLSKAGKGWVFGGMMSVLCSGLAVAAEKAGGQGFPPGFPPPPPVPGIGGRYLGVDRVVRDDGKTPLTILCKMGYNSVLIFPGRKARLVSAGGNSWTGTAVRTEGGSLVIVDPPTVLPTSTNLVVVFDHGVSIFRMKVVDPDKPFMARTTVRFEGKKKDQRAK